MMIPKKPLSRRTMLRGAIGGIGAALALPLLDAMLDSKGEALANGDPLPIRFVSFFFGNGVRLNRFVPAAEGANYPLSEELAPLNGLSDYVSVLTGFNNHCAPGNKITHHEGMVIFSGYNNQDVGNGQGFYSNAGGPTIDQVIANTKGVGDKTILKSIQLGVSKRPSDVDFGTTMHNLSHAGYLQPLPPEHNPQKVWTTLFDSFTPPKDPAGPLRISVLDLVNDHVARLHQRLGAADRMRLDAHTTAVADLQKQIAALPPICMKPGKPMEANLDVGGNEPLKAVSQIMADLIRYAFKCDITRVASFLFSEGASLTVFSDLGTPYAHHDLTHDGSSVTQNGIVNKGVIYGIERFAYLLSTLKQEPDGPNGTLLDNTVAFCSSDCSEGLTHSVDKQPMLIGGGGGGKLVHPGIHYASKTGQNPSDVLLTLRQIFDPAATEVGKDEPYSNTPFAPLKAV
jgi:hypothetical protein